MFKSIIEAAKNFCVHQVGTQADTQEAIPPQGKTLVAHIDIQTDSHEKYRIYLAADKEFIQQVAHVFLDEEESDHETLHDMALECTNLIVGSAKVIASQKQLHFTIQTPHLEEMEEFNINYTQATTLICNGNKLFIAIEKID